MKKIVIIGILLIIGIKSNGQTYNPDKAAEYARFWCDKRNTIDSPYLDTNKWGGPYIDYARPINGNGDCAAFVSQCLLYGGLDLSKGSNGNGGHVKPIDGVIAGAKELVAHLGKYQNTTKTPAVRGYSPPADHDVGDPMFFYNGYPTHSHICNSMDENAKRLYSAHNEDRCDADRSAITDIEMIFFHIKSSIPAHCDNCEKDGDETGMDCGGSCPPCEHAPNNKSYTSNTSPGNPLPAATYAIQNITAGNADVRVYPQGSTSFYAIGSVDLLPGFWAMEGSDFNVQMKTKRQDATADCNAYCDPLMIRQFLYKTSGHMLDWLFTNVSYIDFEIWQQKGRIGNPHYLVHSDRLYPPQEGIVSVWDLNAGNPHYERSWAYAYSSSYQEYMFFVEMVVHSCQGGAFSYRVYFSVINQYRSNNGDDGSVPDGDDFLKSLGMENMTDQNDYGECFSIYPNPNSGAFTIANNTDSPIQKVEVHNSMGQHVHTVNGGFSSIQLPIHLQGSLFLRIYTETEMVVKKVVVVNN